MGNRRCGHDRIRWASVRRLQEYAAYSDTAGLSVCNQVQYAYNGLGQLTAEYQSIGGAVNTATTPKVSYAYSAMAGGANHSRLTGIVYPYGRTVYYGYSGTDGAVSRVSWLADDAGGTAKLEQYSYLGAGTIVQASRPQPGTALTYIKQSGDPALENTEDSRFAGDQYTGLDRFGRVIDQRWRKGAVEIDRVKYGYTASGIILTRNVESAGGSGGIDEAYGYDGLWRLTGLFRGTLDANSMLQNQTGYETWTLDAAGNWTGQSRNGTQTTPAHNAQNQMTGSGGVTLSYDANGNLVWDERGRVCYYDAWNRLMQVWTGGGTLVAAYSYDAAGRRVAEGGCAMYWAGEQVVEERSWAGVWQNVWGLMHGGQAVLRDCYTTGLALQWRAYLQQDAGRSVTSVTDASGTVQERYRYWAYGELTITDGNWGLRSQSIYALPYLFQGGRYSWAAGLYHFGAREYSPALGRWTSADPLGYADGSNRYGFARNNPITFIDPTGLAIEASVNANGSRNFTWRDEVIRRPITNESLSSTVFAGPNGPMSGFTLEKGDSLNFTGSTFVSGGTTYGRYMIDLAMPRYSSIDVTNSTFLRGALSLDVTAAGGALRGGGASVRVNISNNRFLGTLPQKPAPGQSKNKDDSHVILLAGSNANIMWGSNGNAPHRTVIDARIHHNDIVVGASTNFADMINLYSVQGTALDPILVDDNHLVGGTNATGGGIIADIATSYAVFANNWVLGPSGGRSRGFGLKVVSGHHNGMYNNYVERCNEGIVIYDGNREYYNEFVSYANQGHAALQHWFAFAGHSATDNGAYRIWPDTPFYPKSLSRFNNVTGCRADNWRF